MLSFSHVHGIETFAAILQFEGYDIVFLNLIDQTCGVYKVLLV
jgi:hypothetical protein